MAWTWHRRSVLFAISIPLVAASTPNSKACNPTALIEVSEQSDIPSRRKVTFASKTYHPTDDNEFYRSAYSEAERYSTLEHQWRIVEPNSITMLPLKDKDWRDKHCTGMDASASSHREASVCGKLVIDEIRDQILKQAPQMEKADALALAERTAYSCGQALPNEWWGDNLPSDFQLLGSHSSPEQQCAIYMKPGLEDKSVSVTSIIRSIWAKYGETQNYKSCMRTNIEGKESEAYPATISFIKRTDKSDIKSAFAKAKDQKTIAESGYADLIECYSDYQCMHFFGEEVCI